MEAVSNELTFFTLPNCFELFGFDLMVDEDYHVWLLEVCRPLTICHCQVPTLHVMNVTSVLNCGLRGTTDACSMLAVCFADIYYLSSGKCRA